MSNLSVGDLVRCHVAVGCKLTPMHSGRVTEVRSGYYMVDRMSLHDGAPWICAERWVTPLTPAPAVTGKEEP